MVLPPHDSGYHLEYTDAWIFYISGFVWIPYTLFTWYLYWEHKSRNQYPQYFIIQFLAMGCTARTIWLFIYPYSNGVWMKVLSRLAMLFQFSAISLLMLMWDRALKVTRQMDKGVNLRTDDRSTLSIRENAMGRTLRLLAQENTRMRTTNESNSSAISSLSEYETRRELDMESLVRKRVAWIAVNVVAYLLIIGSVIVETSETVYQINLCLIGLMSLIVDVGILNVGLSNYFRLRRELKPVFMNSSAQEASVTATGHSAGQSEKGKCRMVLSYCCCGLDSFLLNWNSSDAGAGGAHSVLKMQAQVIRVLLWVSMTVAIFFFIRAFCFIYFPLDPQSVIFNQENMVGELTYPLFLYQFPEFFPNLAIAIGISPPSGVLRVWLWRIGEYKSQVMRDIEQKKKCWLCACCSRGDVEEAETVWPVVDAGAAAGSAVGEAAHPPAPTTGAKATLLSDDVQKSDVDSVASPPTRYGGGLFGRLSGLFSRGEKNRDVDVGEVSGVNDDDSDRSESFDSDDGTGGIRIPGQYSESTRMRKVSDALEEYIYTASSYASSYSTSKGVGSFDTSGSNFISSPEDQRVKSGGPVAKS